MMVKITRRDIVSLNFIISKLRNKSNLNSKFVYALVKNSKSIANEIEAIRAAIDNKVDGFSDFESQRLALCKKYSSKTDSGDPEISLDGNYVIAPEFQKVFDDEVNALRETFSDCLAAEQRRIEDLTKDWLNEEIEVNIHQISSAYLPEILSFDEVQSLFPMLTDNLCE
jgi:hypothetical protein